MRLAELEALDRILADPPAHIRLMPKINNQFDVFEDFRAEFRLPPGVQFDERGEPYLHDDHGKGGNDGRAADKHDRIWELKRKYPEVWNQRNGAKEIAKAEGLSVETVRRYFRGTR